MSPAPLGGGPPPPVPLAPVPPPLLLLLLQASTIEHRNANERPSPRMSVICHLEVKGRAFIGCSRERPPRRKRDHLSIRRSRLVESRDPASTSDLRCRSLRSKRSLRPMRAPRW